MTRYAEVGDGYVAYQVFGQGPDVAFIPQWFSNVEALWELPPLARFVERLARFARVILFDKRGTGLSDPMPPCHSEPFVEQLSDDLIAVLDAAGSERAAIVAGDSSGLMASVFAATHPSRVTRLVLIDAYARLDRQEACSASDAAALSGAEQLAQVWLGNLPFGALAPCLTRDVGMAAELLRFLRRSASPGAVRSARAQLLSVDVRDVLSSIQAPTLVIHRRDDRFVAADHGRELAQGIPNARLMELAGDEHLCFLGDQETILDEIDVFITGQRHLEPSERVLATVLFTDIVGSTEITTRLGDRRWREILDRYEECVASSLERYRGRLIKSTGDGTLATFDGPARAIRCAREISEAVRTLGLEVRSGLHTGEVEARADDINGIAVNIAQRVQMQAGAHEVYVSRTVADLIAGSGITLDDRGETDLKGVPGTWRLYSVRT